MLEKILKWLKALTMPALLVAATVALFLGKATTLEWATTCATLLAFWLGPKGYRAVTTKKEKSNETT